MVEASIDEMEVFPLVVSFRNWRNCQAKQRPLRNFPEHFRGFNASTENIALDEWRQGELKIPCPVTRITQLTSASAQAEVAAGHNLRNHLAEEAVAVEAMETILRATANGFVAIVWVCTS